MDEQMSDLLPGEATRLLNNLEDSTALGRVVGLLYDDLRRLASRFVARDQTLQPTALVNEVFVYLNGKELDFENRNHFMNASALIMRQVLSKYARAKQTDKRGGGAAHLPMDESLVPAAQSLDPEYLVMLDQAFRQLENLDERKYSIASMRFYLGLSIDEIAEMMELNPRTVRRDWQFCRVWLASEVK